MNFSKPQPKELIVRRLEGFDLLKITTSSADAAAWIEREAPQFGALTGPSLMLPSYLLAVGDVWDTDEVLTYLMSYTTDNAPPPMIVCLCGSTRFWRTFQKAGLRETLAGKIVLSIGAASGTDDEHFGGLSREEYDRVKKRLDELHLRKIDLADEVLILNVGGYVGESTSRELAYARSLGKAVRFWEEGGQS